jgi:hypothetical protein
MHGFAPAFTNFASILVKSAVAGANGSGRILEEEQISHEL